MNDLQVFFRRRRKTLTHIAALLTLGIAAMFAVLPRADAHGVLTVSSDPKVLLLSPEPVSGKRFGTFYAVPHP
jgi:hypothetical protein